MPYLLTDFSQLLILYGERMNPSLLFTNKKLKHEEVPDAILCTSDHHLFVAFLVSLRRSNLLFLQDHFSNTLFGNLRIRDKSILFFRALLSWCGQVGSISDFIILELVGKKWRGISMTRYASKFILLLIFSWRTQIRQPCTDWRKFRLPRYTRVHRATLQSRFWKLALLGFLLLLSQNGR